MLSELCPSFAKCRDVHSDLHQNEPENQAKKPPNTEEQERNDVSLHREDPRGQCYRRHKKLEIVHKSIKGRTQQSRRHGFRRYCVRNRAKIELKRDTAKLTDDSTHLSGALAATVSKIFRVFLRPFNSSNILSMVERGYSPNIALCFEQKPS